MENQFTKAKQLLNEFDTDKKKEIISKIETNTKKVEELNEAINKYKTISEKNKINEADQRILYAGFTSKELKQLWDSANKVKYISDYIMFNIAGLFAIAGLLVLLLSIDSNNLSILGAIIAIIASAVSLSLLINKRSNLQKELENVDKIDNIELKSYINQHNSNNDNAIDPSILRNWVIANQHTELDHDGLSAPIYSFKEPNHFDIAKMKYNEYTYKKKEILSELEDLMFKLDIINEKE